MNSANLISLTPNQFGLWQSQLLHPETPLLDESIVVELSGRLDMERVCEAWMRVVARFPILQARIEESSEGVGMRVSELPIDVIQVSMHDLPDSEACAWQWVTSTAQRALDFKGALVQVAVLDVGDERWWWYCKQHHTVADAWSAGLIWNALVEEYDKVGGQLSGAKRLHVNDVAAKQINFLDYASAMAENTLPSSERANSDSADARLHWQQRTGSMPLYPYQGRSGKADTAATREQLTLDSDAVLHLSAAMANPMIRSWSRELTLHQLILCAWCAYLYRVSGTQQLQLSVPLSGRFDSNTKTMAGHLIEMVPVQINITPAMSFEELYKEVQRETSCQLKYTTTGSEQHNRKAQPTIVMNSIKSEFNSFTDAATQVHWLHSGHMESSQLMRLHVVDWNNTGLPELYIDFLDSYFSPALRKRAVNHFNVMLRSMLSSFAESASSAPALHTIQPGGISAVPLVDDDEVWHLVHHDNPLVRPASAPETINKQAVDTALDKRVSDDTMQASTLPESGSYEGVLQAILSVGNARAHLPALIQGNDIISYSQLLCLIETSARQWSALGVGAGDRVVIYLPRSWQVIPLILGLHAVRAAYVPIDATQAIGRALTIIEDVCPAIIVTNAVLAKKLVEKRSSQESSGNAVSSFMATSASLVGVIDTFKPALKSGCADTTNQLYTESLVDEPKRGLLRAIPDCTSPTVAATLDASVASPRSVEYHSDRDDTAYILYTSGSTGTPKGVVVSQRAFANYAHWAADEYGQCGIVSMPLFTPLGFDLTVTSIVVPLLTGGTVHISPETSFGLAIDLFEILDQAAVNTIKLTPAHLALLQGADFTGSGVRQLIVGGEDLSSAVALSALTSFGDEVRLYNEYGPTEATVGCVVKLFDPQQKAAGSVPIGKPVAGMHAYVLNEAMQPQPQGVAGELYLAGPSLADGYWQKMAATDQAFVADILDKACFMYRTGDVVRVNDDNEIIYMGRQDQQLSVRGVRIEPAEVEAALLSLPGVGECVVTTTQFDAQQCAEINCIRCGLSSRYPDAHFDEDDLCSLCSKFDRYQERANQYFRPLTELQTHISESLAKSGSGYDGIMLLSGGKDSTYALARLKDMGLNLLAYTLDNGYISDGAKANISRVCKTLQVDHEFASTPAMNPIFADSLKRFSNVCNGCFKTIYTLSTQRALELSIPLIFTGLSRGQFFETRLTEELFKEDNLNDDAIDDIILNARKAYHRQDDVVSELLDVTNVRKEDTFEKVKFVDFYRYCPVALEDMLEYLENRVPWIRPSDTGRSTNCLINDVGIAVHKLEKGFHNYSFPYSWDVRLGHKQREEALDELDDEIDNEHVQKILKEIGYTVKSPDTANDSHLVVYYVNKSPTSRDEVYAHLEARLPALMMPRYFVELDSLPLSDNGKVDRRALPAPSKETAALTTVYEKPVSQVHLDWCSVWEKALGLERIGIADNFFATGGDSLLAIRIVASMNSLGYGYQPSDVFAHQTIALLGSLDRPAKPADSSEAELRTKFSGVSTDQLSKLSTLISKFD